MKKYMVLLCAYTGLTFTCDNRSVSVKRYGIPSYSRHSSSDSVGVELGGMITSSEESELDWIEIFKENPQQYFSRDREGLLTALREGGRSLSGGEYTRGRNRILEFHISRLKDFEQEHRWSVANTVGYGLTTLLACIEFPASYAGFGYLCSGQDCTSRAISAGYLFGCTVLGTVVGGVLITRKQQYNLLKKKLFESDDQKLIATYEGVKKFDRDNNIRW